VTASTTPLLKDVTARSQHGLAEHSHVGGATVRTRGVDSHLHGIGSADPADHRLPSAKDEVWRFTPLRRLRGLDDDRVFEGIVGADNDLSLATRQHVPAQRCSPEVGQRGQIVRIDHDVMHPKWHGHSLRGSRRSAGPRVQTRVSPWREPAARAPKSLV